jgi:hypothetical protein
MLYAIRYLSSNSIFSAARNKLETKSGTSKLSKDAQFDDPSGGIPAYPADKGKNKGRSSKLLPWQVIAIAKISFLLFPSPLVGEGQGEG